MPIDPNSLPQDPEILKQMLVDVTVQQDKLAVEVLNLLDRHQIDDLVVVDDANVPVGLVDSQDLTKLKLL